MRQCLLARMMLVSTVATIALLAASCAAGSDASESDGQDIDSPDGLQSRPAFNPGHGPFCTFNCGPVTAAISASPSPVFLPPNTAGNTTLHWTWNESRATPVAEYACVYVSVNDESSMHVVDCEHPGNNYTVPISWIVAPNSYLFTVAISNLSNPPALPKGSLPVLATTVVRGVISQ